MKKIAVLIEDNYHVLETMYPYYYFKGEGFETILVGTGAAEYKSKEGIPQKSDASIESIKSSDVAGVIVPGGFAPDKLRQNAKVLAFVKECFDQGKVVASICHGPWVLISAKILKGKKVTATPAIKDDLENAGALYSDSEVVVDGNLVTSRKPADLPAFVKSALKLLS